MDRMTALSISRCLQKLEGKCIKSKEDAADLLFQFASSQESNDDVLFCHAGLIPALVKNVKTGETDKLKESAVLVLFRLAIEEKYNRSLFLHHPSLFPALVKAVEDKASSTHLKEGAMMSLAIFATEPENRPVMMAHPSAISIVLKTIKQGESVILQENALAVFNSLAETKQNCRPLFLHSGLVTAVVKLADKGRSLCIKGNSLGVLACLACETVSCRDLFLFPGLMPTLIHTLELKEVDNSTFLKKYSASLLVNLAVNAENCRDMISSPSTMHSLIGALIAIKSCQVKDTIIEVFRGFSFELSKELIVFFPKLVPVLIQTMNDSESTQLRTRAANTLSNLVRGTQAAFLVPELLPFLVHMMNNEESDVLKEEAAKELQNYADTNDSNCRELFLWNGFLSALLRALEAESEDLQLLAGEIILTLSETNENLRDMFLYPGLLPAVLNAVETELLMTIAVEVLRSLTFDTENRREMFLHPQIIPLLIHVLDTGNRMVTKESAVRTLQRFASETEYCRALFVQNESLIPTLLKTMLGEEHFRVKRISALFLQNLAVEAQNRQEMFSHPGFIAALITLLEAEQTLELKSCAIETLYLISCEVHSEWFTDYPQLEQKVTRVMEISYLTSCALLTWINMTCDTECVFLEEILTLVRTRVLNRALRKEGDWTIQHALLAYWQLSKVEANRSKMLQLGFLASIVLVTSAALQEHEEEAIELGLKCFNLFARDKDALEYFQQHSESFLDMELPM